MVGFDRQAEIDVFVRSVPAPLESLERDLRTLSAAERLRASRIVSRRKRAEFIAGRRMLRDVLASALATAPVAVDIETDESGRPRLRGQSGLDFNLSHSGGLVLLAVARHTRVAVDVERVKPERAHAAIAERFFSTEERAEIEAAEPSFRTEAFYDIWTCKEAYVKALGRSVFSCLSAVSVAPAAGRVLRAGGGEDPSCWRLRRLDVGSTHRASLCWESRGDARCRLRVHDERP